MTQDALTTGGVVGAVIILAQVVEILVRRYSNGNGNWNGNGNGASKAVIQRLYEAHLKHDLVQERIMEELKEVAKQQHATVQVLNKLTTRLEARLPRVFD